MPLTTAPGLSCVSLDLADVFLCLQAEPDGFAMFHLYVCAAFLTKFSLDLQHEKDFQVQYTHVQHFDWTNVLKNVVFFKIILINCGKC